MDSLSDSGRVLIIADVPLCETFWCHAALMVSVFSQSFLSTENDVCCLQPMRWLFLESLLFLVQHFDEGAYAHTSHWVFILGTWCCTRGSCDCLSILIRPVSASFRFSHLLPQDVNHVKHVHQYPAYIKLMLHSGNWSHEIGSEKNRYSCFAIDIPWFNGSVATSIATAAVWIGPCTCSGHWKIYSIYIWQ